MRNAVLVLCAGLALASCGGDDPPAAAEATPAPPAIETVTPAIETVTPEPEATATPEPDPLAALEPCALLPRAKARALGLADPRPEQLGDARVCRWRHEGATLVDSYTVSVELFPLLGVDDAVAEESKPLGRIAGHRAERFVTAAGTCGVALAVEPSRVDATAVGGARAGACRYALRLARAVAPRLPSPG